MPSSQSEPIKSTVFVEQTPSTPSKASMIELKSKLFSATTLKNVKDSVRSIASCLYQELFDCGKLDGDLENTTLQHGKGIFILQIKGGSLKNY